MYVFGTVLCINILYCVGHLTCSMAKEGRRRPLHCFRQEVGQLGLACHLPQCLFCSRGINFHNLLCPARGLKQKAYRIKCRLVQAVMRYNMQLNAKSMVTYSSSSVNSLSHHGSSSEYRQFQFGFFLVLVAEVHDCHLMGAVQFRISHERAKGPVTFSLSCQFEIWIVVCLSNLGIQIFGMNCSLLFQKIEIIDDEESDMISNSEVDQMSSLLDYKVSN